MVKQLTPKEYADLRGLTLQAVTYNLRKNIPMPGVIEFKKFSRFYLLTVDVKVAKNG